MMVLKTCYDGGLVFSAKTCHARGMHNQVLPSQHKWLYCVMIFSATILSAKDMIFKQRVIKHKRNMYCRLMFPLILPDDDVPDTCRISWCISAHAVSSLQSCLHHLAQICIKFPQTCCIFSAAGMSLPPFEICSTVKNYCKNHLLHYLSYYICIKHVIHINLPAKSFFLRYTGILIMKLSLLWSCI